MLILFFQKKKKIKSNYFSNISYNQRTNSNLNFLDERMINKKDKNNYIIDKIDFHFEINCGKKNNIDSFSKKTQEYSYQMYYEMNVLNSLPEKI